MCVCIYMRPHGHHEDEGWTSFVCCPPLQSGGGEGGAGRGSRREKAGRCHSNISMNICMYNYGVHMRERVHAHMCACAIFYFQFVFIQA